MGHLTLARIFYYNTLRFTLTQKRLYEIECRKEFGGIGLKKRSFAILPCDRLGI